MSEEQNYTAAEGAESKKQARKRAEGLWWAGALIWAGLVFGADSLDLLPTRGVGCSSELAHTGCSPTSTTCVPSPPTSQQAGIGFGRAA